LEVDGSLASARFLLFYQFDLTSKFVWFCIVSKNGEMDKASLKSLIKEPEATNSKVTWSLWIYISKGAL